MDITAEKRSKYEELLRDASKTYLSNQYQRALGIYNEVLPIATALKISKPVVSALKYLICRCLLESNNLDNLAEVVMTLQSMEQSVKEKFPAIYTLLAKAHCKLLRYDKALEAIKEGDAVYDQNAEFPQMYIPGTHVAIEQGKNEPSWLDVKEECSVWHKPDAICCITDCINITKPYVTANRNIFKNDPAFNGMVIAVCNNKTNPCSLKFHQACWKHKKDELFPVQRVSDKEMIGIKCFTPNCMNDDTPCIISSIEIMDKNGEVKANIKDSTPAAWPVNKSSLSKGAIKKTKVHTENKIASPIVQSDQQNESKLFNRRDGYDENQILAIKDYSRTIDFSNDPPNVAGEKQFVFSLFHDYIQNNLVRVCDVYSTFSDINENLAIKDMDILTFLLETNKIEVLDNRNPMPLQLETQQYQHQLNPQDDEKDIDDVYDQILNDDGDDYENQACSNNYNNNQAPMHQNSSQYGFSNTNAFNQNYQGGGDAPPHMRYNVDNRSQLSNYDKPIEDASSSVHQPEKKQTENRKLKDYITQLESNMKEMMDESVIMKKELKKKDNTIEDMTKDKDEMKKKIEICESLCETIDDFQQKYKIIQDQNIAFKEEVINLMKENKELKSSSNQGNSKIDFMKIFQAEYKILQDCINAEWEVKVKKLRESYDNQIDVKMIILSKYLDCQYLLSQNQLDKYISKCNVALAVFNRINDWMYKNINVENFFDTSNWSSKLNAIQKVSEDQQTAYSTLVEELQSDSLDKIAKDDVVLKLPELPNVIQENEVSDAVENALDALYEQQQELLEKQTSVTQQMQPEVHPNPYYPHPYYPYPMIPPQVNTSGFPRPLHYPQYPQGTMPNASYQPRGMPMPSAPPGFMPQFQQQAAPAEKSAINVPIVAQPFVSNGSIGISASTKVDSLGLNLNKLEKKREDLVQTNVIKASDLTSNGNNNNVDDISAKIAKMREAFKTVVMNVKEKSAVQSSSEDEQASNTTVTVPKQVDNYSINSLDKKSVESVVEKIRDDRSDITTVTVQDQPIKAKNKITLDQLCKMMLEKYPGAMEVDVVEIIAEIRKKHNYSLSGIPVNQIMRESEEFFLNSQRLHLLRYFLPEPSSQSNQTDTSSKVSGTSYQSALKDVISPASSCNSLNVRSNQTPSPMRCWKTAPASEQPTWDPLDDMENLGCTICMTPIDKILAHTLNCGHVFHNQCITSWLKSDRSCPNCRLMITSDADFPPLRT